VPPEFEDLPQRVSFIHYLALVGEQVRTRLRARLAWREWEEPRIAEMLEFNDWLHATAATTSPPVRHFDTTHVPIDAAVGVAEAWVLGHLGS
jgi:hypothetical protein